MYMPSSTLVLADAAGLLEIADQCPGLLYVQKLGVHGNQHLNRFEAPWASDSRASADPSAARAILERPASTLNMDISAVVQAAKAVERINSPVASSPSSCLPAHRASR